MEFAFFPSWFYYLDNSNFQGEVTVIGRVYGGFQICWTMILISNYCSFVISNDPVLPSSGQWVKRPSVSWWFNILGTTTRTLLCSFGFLKIAQSDLSVSVSQSLRPSIYLFLFWKESKEVEEKKKNHQVAVIRLYMWPLNLNVITPFLFFISGTQFADLCFSWIHHILASPTWPNIILGRERQVCWVSWLFLRDGSLDNFLKNASIGAVAASQECKESNQQLFYNRGKIKNKFNPESNCSNPALSFLLKNTTLSHLVEILRCNLGTVLITVWLHREEQSRGKAI